MLGTLNNITGKEFNEIPVTTVSGFIRVGISVLADMADILVMANPPNQIAFPDI